MLIVLSFNPKNATFQATVLVVAYFTVALCQILTPNMDIYHIKPGLKNLLA
jgi:hypothetical protein